MQCPSCKNDLMVSVPPKGLGKLASLLFLTRYTCIRCGKSTWKFSFSNAKPKTISPVKPTLTTTSKNTYKQKKIVNTGAGLQKKLLPGKIFIALCCVALAAGGIWYLKTTVKSEPVIVSALRQPVNPDNLHFLAATQKPASLRNKREQNTLSSAQPEIVNPIQKKTSDRANPSFQEKSQKKQIQHIPLTPVPADNVKKQSTSPAQRPQEAQQPVAVKEQKKDSVEKEKLIPSQKQGVARLFKVYSQTTGNTVTVFLDIQGIFHDPFGFSLGDRYAVDIPGTWNHKGPWSYPVAEKRVNQMRLGLHPGKVRVVLDYNTKPKKQTIKRTPKGVAITLDY